MISVPVPDSASLRDVAIVVASKITLIGAAGHLALALLRRRSAATRHLIAIATLAAMLLVPLATAVLPPWRLAVLPRPATTSAPSTRSVARDASVPSLHPSTTAGRPAPAVIDESPRALAPSLALPDRSVAGTAPALELPRLGWAGWALGIWISLSALLALRAAVGLLVIAWLARRAAVVEDVRVLAALAWARERLGVRGAVGLRCSPGVMVPLVAGLRRPIIVLPVAAAEWSDARLRAVMLHELAHVRRGDAGTLMLVRVAQCVLGPHPLVWTLSFRAREECERACDDLVLASGVRASEYAHHLLEIARHATDPFAMGITLAFARRSTLEGRLLSILRPDAARGTVSRRGVLVAALVVVVLLAPLAAVRVVAAPASRPHGAADPASHAGDPVSAARSEAVTSPTEADAKAEPEIEARVESDSSIAPDDVELELAESRTGESWNQRAKQLYDAHEYGSSGLAYERAAQAGYRAGTAYYNAACSYALDRQRSRSLGALSEAIDAGFGRLDLLQSDTDLNAIRDDGRYHLLLQKAMHTDQAEEARGSLRERYDQLEESNTTDAGAWNSIGVELMRAGEPDLSVDAFARAERLGYGAAATYNAACAEAIAGRRARALDALERALIGGYGDPDKLRQDPDLISLHGERRYAQLLSLAADLELVMKVDDFDDPSEWREPLAHYEQMARDHADLGRAWFNLGYVRLRVGDAKGSVDAYRRAMDREYRPATTYYNLACGYAQLDDADAAMDYLLRARSAGMDLSSYIVQDRDLDPLRDDPRFKAMVDRSKLEAERERDRKLREKDRKHEQKEQKQKLEHDKRWKS
jgi:beta-lactamase regulating signal transducer with metallopeptidase domain